MSYLRFLSNLTKSIVQRRKTIEKNMEFSQEQKNRFGNNIIF